MLKNQDRVQICVIIKRHACRPVNVSYVEFMKSLVSAI